MDWVWEAWPGAEVGPRDVLIQTIDANGTVVAEELGHCLGVRRVRAARPYVLQDHFATWRCYGELLDSRESELAARVRAFARAYGPSFSIGCDDEPFGDGGQTHAVWFGDLAARWGRADASGISYWQEDVPPDVERTAAIARSSILGWLGSKRPPPRPSLIAFMCERAIAHYDHREPLRRCVGCDMWFSAKVRPNRRACSVTCRKRASRQ
jgi:hypothetical protein